MARRSAQPPPPATPHPPPPLPTTATSSRSSSATPWAPGRAHPRPSLARPRRSHGHSRPTRRTYDLTTGESDGERRSDGDLHGHRHGHGTPELSVAEEWHGDRRSHHRQLHHIRHHRFRQRRPVHGRRQQRRGHRDEHTRGLHSHGPAALTDTLALHAAPTISQPASQMVSAGQTATFTVTATGTAPLSYQWQKNGTAIGAATTASYTTPATTASDNGDQFTVVVSNAARSVTSAAASLTVTTAADQPLMTAFPIMLENHTCPDVTSRSSAPDTNTTLLPRAAHATPN